jgi:ethanolamine utilization cobalamin adenosyltransferase
LGEKELCAALGELLDYLRAMMAAEVKETPLPPPFLFGMDADEIHRRSQEGPFRLPAYTQGPLAVRLNTLRAKIRETELIAVRVFGKVQAGTASEEAVPVDIKPADSIPPDVFPRGDIILALNRLSSALWLLFLRCAKTGPL